MKAFHEKNTYPNGFPVDIFKFNNFSFLAHWHNDIEIVHVYEGQFRMTINSNTRILGAGDTCICCSGDIHSMDSMDLNCTAILAFYAPEIIGSLIKWPEDTFFISSFIDETAKRDYNISPDFSKKVGELLQDTYDELTNKKDAYQMFVRSRLLELHGLIYRNVPKGLNNASHTKSYSMINKIQNALDYINTNYMEDLTLMDVANHADLGISQFSQLFKHMCKMSFVTYLNSIRVSKVEEMILNTDNTITDIALDCGFTSIRNFNRTYKKWKGSTPSDLKKRKDF